MKIPTVVTSLGILTALLVGGCSPNEGDSPSESRTVVSEENSTEGNDGTAVEEDSDNEVSAANYQRKVEGLLDDFEGFTEHYYSLDSTGQEEALRLVEGRTVKWSGTVVYGIDSEIYLYRSDLAQDYASDDLAANAEHPYTFGVFLENFSKDMPTINEGDVVTVRGIIEQAGNKDRNDMWILGEGEVLSVKPGEATKIPRQLPGGEPVHPTPEPPVPSLEPPSSTEGDVPGGFPPNGEELSVEEQVAYEDMVLRYAWHSISSQEQADLCETVDILGMEDAVEIIYISMQREFSPESVERMLLRECLTTV